MVDKTVLSGDEARKKILTGVEVICNSVKVTLGPRGKNVLIMGKDGIPIVTKDGVTVAKAITLTDKFENMGVSVVKQAAIRTNEIAGDGTTTATTLAHDLIKNGNKLLAAGFFADDLKRGMDFAVELITNELRRIALPVNDELLSQVATISANGDANLGSLISSSIKKVGKDGVLLVEEAAGFETTIEFAEGFQLDAGFISPFFINDASRGCALFENPMILLCSSNVSSVKDILGVLEEASSSNRALVIIAEEFDQEFIQTIVMNVQRKALSACLIRAPLYGQHRLDIFDDVGFMTSCDTHQNTKVITSATKNIIGTAKKILISKTKTTIISDNFDQTKLDERVKVLREKLTDPTLDEASFNHLKKRVARLAGGIGVIRVGGVTNVDVKEKRDRVDDAINATLASLEDGIVPGGGAALVRAREVLDVVIKLEKNHAYYSGIKLVYDACLSPLSQMLINADIEPAVVIDKLSMLDTNIGFDVLNEKYTNMLESGIIDPMKVTRVALENAVAVASMLLSVDALVLID